MKQLIVLFATFAVIFGIFYLVLDIQYENQEVSLRNSITNKIEANQSHFSKMQNIIFGSAEVAEKYSKDFKEIYPKLMEGRYGKGDGTLMKWIQESHPNYSPELLATLQRQIEAERNSFHQTQLQLIDFKRSHDNLLDVFPGSFFLSDKKKIDVPIVKNKGTVEIFENETEEPKSLF